MTVDSPVAPVVGSVVVVPVAGSLVAAGPLAIVSEPDIEPSLVPEPVVGSGPVLVDEPPELAEPSESPADVRAGSPHALTTTHRHAIAPLLEISR